MFLICCKKWTWKKKEPFSLFLTKFYDNLEKNRCSCGAWLLYRYIDVFRKICMEKNQSKKKKNNDFDDVCKQMEKSMSISLQNVCAVSLVLYIPNSIYCLHLKIGVRLRSVCDVNFKINRPVDLAMRSLICLYLNW